MTRPRTFVTLLGALAAAAAAIAFVRHFHGVAKMRREPGGTLIGDTVAYDRFSRLMLGSFYWPIAADIAAAAPDGARILEVGCGPGHLSIRLAREYGLDVTGLDLDPAMIERARANADSAGDADERRPSFLVGDVASMPFPDESFDLVVSTMSMHHWADPTAGLTEIDRVLRPGGRALVWDFRRGFVPLHQRMPDPVEHTHGSPLRVVGATSWRWPWRFHFIQRIELVGDAASSGHPGQ